MHDLISIIVPIYNAERHLSKILDSVILQTYVHWELILVNDGSTDRTEEIIKEYLKKDERIYYFQQSNAGPSAARNTGIKEAKGVYLSFMDSDDWVSDDYLEKLIQPMITTNIDLVCAGYYEINSKFPNGLKLHDFNEDKQNTTITKKEFQANLFQGVSGVLWGKLFKNELFKKNKIRLNPNLRLSEDLLTVLEYSTFIENVYIIPDSIYYYNRFDEKGLSGQMKISNYQDLKIFLKEVDKYKVDLSFLDLKTILNKRKYTFMVKLLKDNSSSKNEFYKVAKFLVQNESTLDSKILQNQKINDNLIKWIFSEKYFKAWLLLKIYSILKKIKHG